MTHEEFDAWTAGFDGKDQSEQLSIARMAFLKESDLTDDEALEIIEVFERKGDTGILDEMLDYYYWENQKKFGLEEKVDELEDEVYRKSETILRLKSNFLEAMNAIYHLGSIQEAREFIDKTLDID